MAFPPRISLNHQPWYPGQIDRSNWLGRRVTACIANHYANSRVEMISGVKGTQIGSGESHVLTPAGYGSTPAAATSGTYWSTSPNFCNFQNGSNSVDSIAVLVTRIGSGSAFDRILDNSQTNGGWDLEADGSNGIVLVTWFGSANFNFTSTGAMTLGRPYMLVMSYATAHSSPNTAYWYVNGQLIQAAFTGVTASSGQMIAHCFSTAGANCGTAFAIHYAAFFHGYALTQMDAQQLTGNPWMLFASPQRFQSRMFSPAAATTSIPPGAQSFPFIARG